MHPECSNYAPVKKEIKKLPKQWIINMAYTVLGHSFADWVHKQIEARNEKVTKEKNLLIDMDPDIARAFAQSTAVSCKSFHMILVFQLAFKFIIIDL